MTINPGNGADRQPAAGKQEGIGACRPEMHPHSKESERPLYPLWGAVVAVLHRFPDAFQAVTNAITEHTRLHPEPIGVVFT